VNGGANGTGISISMQTNLFIMLCSCFLDGEVPGHQLFEIPFYSVGVGISTIRIGEGDTSGLR
jgi:hypothetical protein